MNYQIKPPTWIMAGLLTLLLVGGSRLAAVADGNADPAGPYLGRWDLTLHTPARDYSSWLDIQENGGGLRARMVGRWGRARWLPQAAIANGRISFVSPGNEEGRANGDMVFDGERIGDELVGTTSGPAGKLGPGAASVPRRCAGRRYHDAAIRSDCSTARIAGWTMTQCGGKAVARRRWHAGQLGRRRGSESLAKYGDFSLHIEFNCSRGADSGVYLRGRYEGQIEDDAEPERPSERIAGIYGFIAPKVPAPRAGIWHAFDITLIGRRVTVVFDGTTLINAEEIPGITAVRSRQPRGLPGPILLQGSEMGEVAYRNIVLTPLLAAEPAADVPSACAASARRHVTR